MIRALEMGLSAHVVLRVEACQGRLNEKGKWKKDKLIHSGE